MDVDTHGFFTMGYSISNSSTKYLDSVSNEGSFTTLSKAGFQLGSTISDRLSAKIQFLAEGRPDNSFTPKLDLAQIRYLAFSSHEVILGRIRLPLFMISDYRMVGALYPWNIPPAEIYEILPDEAAGSKETFIGANIVSRLLEFSHWTLQSELYGGGGSSRFEPPGKQIDAMAKQILGATLSLSSNSLLFRASYLNTVSKSTTTITSGSPSGSNSIDSSLGRLQFLTAGSKWEPGNLLWMTEFSKIMGESTRFRSVYSGYTTLGYHFFNRSILLHGTVAKIFDSTQSTDDLAQLSVSGGLNLSLTDSTVIKVEAQRSNPSGSQNNQKPPPAGGAGGNTSTGQKGLFANAPGQGVTILHVSVNTAF
jgi:hypothetical protein